MCRTADTGARSGARRFFGRILAGNCEQFDEWLLAQREHFRVQVTSALEQLAAFHERAGQLAEAERAIRRLLEYDPLSEAAYRQLMRVLARADQRSAALDVYETCRRMLATELGLAPAIETVTLAEQIRALAPAVETVTPAEQIRVRASSSCLRSRLPCRPF